MIWGILLILAVLVGAYLVQPFFGSESAGEDTALAEARAQIAGIERDAAEGRMSAEAASKAKEALERRVLALLDAPGTQAPSTALRSTVLYAVPAILLLGGVGLYTQVGNPGFEPITVAEFQAERAAGLPQTLPELVVELRKRLEADPNPPADGYVLLARSYLRLGEVEAGLEAYETAITRSGNDPQIVSERDDVIRFLRERANAPQIDPDTAAAIQQMSPDEQAAMIEGMVEGLAVRLEQDPNDLQGWLRLIRARTVLGDMAQARLDLENARSAFAEDDDAILELQNLADQVLPPQSE